jgi:type IX secretion system PorP/SprF family membrane protein
LKPFKFYIPIFVLHFFALSLIAQDVPLFTQKLSNSFLYNPSFAGYGFGSVTLTHQTKLSDVLGAGSTNFISVHTPISRRRFGVGINVFTEDINVLSNLFASAAFAYHLKLGDFKSLSVGVSAEYSKTTLNASKIRAIGDPNNPNLDLGDFSNDPVLVDLFANDDTNLDFSFGVNFQTKHLRVGGSLNRLATTFRGNEKLDVGGTPGTGGTDIDLLTNFYTAYLQFMIPVVNNRDLIEPVITVRQLSTIVDPQFDFGIYYTWNERVIIGGAYQTGAGTYYNLTAGYRFNNRLLLGYTYQTASVGDFGSLGNTSEFSLRFDFAQQSYQTKFNKYRVQTKTAMAYRRKTLSRQIKTKPASLKQPSKAYHKKYSRGRKDLSPNRRLRYKSNKLKTVKTKRFNTKKRRKSNYKQRKQKFNRNRRRR